MKTFIAFVMGAALLTLAGCTTTSTTTTESTTTRQPQTNATTDSSIYTQRTTPMTDRGPR